MKKSLLALSLASLVALVGCGQSAPKLPVGRACMETFCKEMYGKKKVTKGEGVVERDASGFYDVESENNGKAEYFLAYEGLKDVWATAFYIFVFEKVGSTYKIVEEGTEYSFTLEQLNFIGNNIMYDYFDPEKTSDEHFSYDELNWICTDVYDPVEVDEDDDSLVSSHFQFLNCKKTQKVADATLVIDGYVFVRDEINSSTGITNSYLFIEIDIGDINEYTA